MKFQKSMLLALGLVFCCSSYAASDGIRSNRLNECAIWLCAPGGFGEGCGAARSAFIGRITDFTGGAHPKRRYTSIPAMSNCIDDIGPTASTTNMTYKETYVAYVPEHKVCKKIAYIESGDSYMRKCVLFETVPETKVADTMCEIGEDVYDDYGQVINNTSHPAFCTKTINRISIYGDGVLYGTPFDYVN